MIVQRGTPGPTAAPSDLDWSSTSGFSSVFTYRGTRAELQGAFGALTIGAQRASIRTEGNGPMAVLTVTFGNAMDGTQADQDNLLTETWTLDGNDLEKPLFSHPKFAALSSTQQQYLREEARGDDSNRGSIDPSGDPAEFLTEIINGTTAYTISQYVLKRVIVIDPAWTSQIDVSNAGNYYATTAALMAAEPNIPTIILPTLPDGMWLKRTPTITQQSNGKFEAVQEWWHADEWSSLLYDVAT